MSFARVYMAWKGIEGDQSIYWASFDGTSWSNQQLVPNVGTSIGPALAPLADKLYMAWKGVDSDQSIYWASLDGHTWSNQQLVPNVGTSIGPALANFVTL